MQLIGEIFYEFRARLFYLNDELINKCLVVFFRITKNRWIALSISDGKAEFKVEDSSPIFTEFTVDNDIFTYPLERIKVLDKYVGDSINNIMEYRLKDDKNDCVGIYFDCRKKSFSIIENEMGLSIIDGKDEALMEHVILCPSTCKIGNNEQLNSDN